MLVSLLLLSSGFADSGIYRQFGVKDAGGGLATSSQCLDASSILMNPASAGLLRANCFTAGYSRFAYGIGGSSIERGLGCYVYHRPYLGGAGISFAILNQDISYYTRMGLTVAPELWILRRWKASVGLTGAWYQTGYRPSQFEGHDIGPDPIFEQGYQKNVFGISLGALANVYDKLWWGLTIRDINEPNLALQDTVTCGKLPLEIQTGFSYPVDKYFHPSLDFMWRNETINEKQLSKLRIGAVSTLPHGLQFRVGYERILQEKPTIGSELGFGLTYHSEALFGGFDIDYAFVYPLGSDRAEAGAVNHHFGVSIWAIEPRPATVDLVANEVRPEGLLIPGVRGEITGVLSNRGWTFSDGFSVTLAAQDSTGNWKIIYPVKYLDGIMPDSVVTLTWPWKPKNAGTYTLRMTVDDDGRTIPVLNGKLDERKEDNNTVETATAVGVSGRVVFTLQPRKAWVTRMEYLVEEAPLVPVVFFDAGSAALDSESVELLRIYAERLHLNPDAKLVIEGFFDPSDGVVCTTASELALKRAENIRDTILSVDKGLEDRVAIANKISCAKPIYRIDPTETVAEAELVAQENRRAELRVEFPNAQEIIAEYNLAVGDTDVPADITFDDSTIAILKRNEHAIVLIEGGFAPGEDSVLGLARTEKLCSRIEAYDPDILPGKIRIVPGWEGPTLRATLTGEGNLWAPTVSRPNVIGYEKLDPPKMVIGIKTIGFDGVPVDSSYVNIVNDEGDFIRNLYRGRTLPPDSVIWDWRNEGGHLIFPEQVVHAQAIIFVAGTPLTYLSEGEQGRMQVQVRDIQRRIRRLLVVQFVFDETVPTSQFLESRLDGLAFDIITNARAKLAPSAFLAGHTDAIGSPEHNQNLSERRAKRELAILRLYFMHHLGLKNSAELDEWLTKEKIQLGAAGYGASRPYTLQATDSDGIPVMLGDNKTPRGRTVNRRVTVEHGIDEETSKE